MIDYKVCQFAAPPRTGVGWFIRAAQAVGLGPGFRERAYSPFDGSKGFRLSLARHPCTWLGSCFRSLKDQDGDAKFFWPLTNLVFISFDTFVRGYLKEVPGCLGELSKMYEANSFLRIEDMPDAFEEAALMLGVPPAMASRCRGVGAVDEPTMWNLELRAQVMLAEREYAETYDYF